MSRSARPPPDGRITLQSRRVPVRVRGGAHGAGGRALRAEPDRPRRSTAFWRGSADGRARPHAELRPRGTPTPWPAIAPPAATAPGTRRWRMAPDGHHRGGEEVEPPRAGRRGFPTGTKWSFIPKNRTGPVYLVVNADEGEPGTFKDRYLLERDPHALIEGMLIAARAIRSALGFVYIRGEYVQPWRRLQRRPSRRRTTPACWANIRGGLRHRRVHRGAGAYICGEETGLLSSLEGKKGWPKIKPPFPGDQGRLRPADHRQQRRDARCVPPHHRRAARSGSPGSAPRRRAARGSTRCPAT